MAAPAPRLDPRRGLIRFKKVIAMGALFDLSGKARSSPARRAGSAKRSPSGSLNMARMW